MSTFLVRVYVNLVGQSCSHAGADSLASGADTNMAVHIIPVMRLSQIVPRVATVGGYFCNMEQDAQYEVGETERCVLSCFAACAGMKSSVVISPTFSLLPTSSASRNRTTFLHFESAKDCV